MSDFPAPITIQSALSDAIERLAPLSATPRLDSELLLSAVLKRSRTYLLAFPETSLTDQERDHFSRLIDQRCQRIPVAYLLGEKEFWSRPFLVNRDVLIPRPDSETVIELLLSRFPSSKLNLLELGTGSGALAVTLQLERPNWCITATDRSLPALRVARKNGERLHAPSIHWLISDWFSALTPQPIFDLIVSNPPYLAENDPHLSDLASEPQLALTSGKEGLDDIRALVSTAPHYLSDGGWLLIEHGSTQGEAVRTLFQERGFIQVDSVRDLSQQERITLGAFYLKS